MRIALLALGLHDLGDSVGYDCVYQHQVLTRQSGGHDVDLFAEEFRPERYPGLTVGDADAFQRWCDQHPDGTVVFHYCDSRSKFDDLLRRRTAPTVIRWHNNTPPWFNFGAQNAIHSLVGFENLLEFIQAPHIRFWVNSDFTREQLIALGCEADRAATVFPASRYLERRDPPAEPLRAAAPDGAGGLHLLFVGRVVTHKGHRAAIEVASRVQAAAGRPVTLHFAGRSDAGLARFNRDLEASAAQSRATVVFHGEVSDEALATLYGRADVFLCLSEHEGFGLPVFEAMRCRVPVVAWATTALGELLADHPLAFTVYDLDAFAAATLALRDPELRAQVLASQDVILGRYTEAVVARQLTDAVADLDGGTERERPRLAGSPALLQHPLLVERLAGWIAEADGRFRSEEPDLVHDSGTNLVSLYDIAQYRGYFERQTRIRFASLEAWTTEPAIDFAPREFASPHAIAQDDALTIPDASYGTGFLIYGPYAEFPPGRYEATLDLEVRTGDEPVSFEVDVNAQSVGVLGRQVVDPAGLAPVAAVVPFTVASQHALIEFRLRATRPFTGGVALRGVRVRMLDERGGPGRPSPRERRPSWLDRVRDRLMTPAQRHFRQADRCRDAGLWLDAAREYGKGLEFEPQAFAFIVQHGHALKQAGLLPEAERAYGRGLELRPDDRDLNLNVGHLYKVMGRRLEAERYFLRALASDRAGLDAADELWRLRVAEPGRDR